MRNATKRKSCKGVWPLGKNGSCEWFLWCKRYAHACRVYMWVAFTRESLVTERLTGEDFLIANLRRKGEGKKSGDVNLRSKDGVLVGWRVSARGGVLPRATTRAENALAQLVTSLVFGSHTSQFTAHLNSYASCKDKKVINKTGASAQPQRKRCGKSHFAWNLFSWFRALAWGSSCEEQKWQWSDNKMNEFLLSLKIIYDALSISLELKLFAI